MLGSTWRILIAQWISTLLFGEIMREAINELSARVGADTSLVQGAGGNISWKDGSILHVKASGTWLAEAGCRDIFVSMDLPCVRKLVEEGAADYVPAMLPSPEGLRPSIETALHALLPFRVVLHLHPVDVIALSVLPEAKQLFAERLGDLAWDWIDYAKPGKELAGAVATKLAGVGGLARVWILANHGLVIGGDSIGEVQDLLNELCGRLRLPPSEPKADIAEVPTAVAKAWSAAGYRFVGHHRVAMLAFDEAYLDICRSAWVLYPDHAVFLGPKCGVFDSIESVPSDNPPVVLIVPGVGVCLRSDAPRAAESMLLCYAEVVARLPDSGVSGLSVGDVEELLDWDAEKFRRAMQCGAWNI